jgi:hypothetical protein
MNTQQSNTHNAKIGETFSYTNARDYTTTIVILEVTEKSVFYRFSNIENMKSRMSWNSFRNYKRIV